MAKMLGELAVNVPADFRARLVRVNEEPVGLYDEGRWRLGLRLRLNRVLRNRRFGIVAGTTRPNTEAKDAGDGDDQEWFRVHGGNSKPD
jgi:hypothetical protein